MAANLLPEWVIFPGDDWDSISPSEAGLDAGRWERFVNDGEVYGPEPSEESNDKQHRWGAVFTRGGYLVRSWGDPAYPGQTASVGKALTWAIFGLAVEDGLVSPDDLVRDTWTGEDQLSHPHKRLDRGHHRTLTWRHLLGDQDIYGHLGGFPVTNGYYWRNATPVDQQRSISVGLFGPSHAPEWSKWTGDPFYDNYSHAPPGKHRIYSSGGIWRLSQALTSLLDSDLKDVADQRLFGPMGIPPDRWRWTPGREVFEDENWYPEQPGYGAFIDPPYTVNGHVVRGGPGWLVISAYDLARFGHLIATAGIWKKDRLVGPEWLRGHHGADSNQVGGESAYFTAMARVSALGIDHPLPGELFAGPVALAPRQ